MGIDLVLLERIIPLFARASLTTLTIAFFATLIGLFGGIILALAQRSTHTLFRYSASFYIAIVRGTPMIVQIVFLFYGLNLPVAPIVIAILAIGMNSAAYISQTIKTGIQAVHKGEIEAAHVMGFSKTQITRYIILPQAFRAIFPSLGNEFITLIKDSSLAYIIGVHEIFKESRNLLSTTYDVVTVYAAVTLFYFAITTIITLLLEEYEKNMERSC